MTNDMNVHIRGITMKDKLSFTAVIVIMALAAGCGPAKDAVSAGASEDTAQAPRGVVEVGDRLSDVEKALGDASIEFPDGDLMVHWFSGYEVTTSNNVVVTVVQTADS